jgi:myosin-7
VSFERVPFIDNQPVLDLIESKPYGLLHLLDEEVRDTLQ